jgi:hypothetical protein
MISGDKAMTQTYCDLVKLGDQSEEIDPKDTKKADELNQQMAELAGKLGPEGGIPEMPLTSEPTRMTLSRNRGHLFRSPCWRGRRAKAGGRGRAAG